MTDFSETLEYLEILIRQMNADVTEFPEKPDSLETDTYNLLKRMYTGYLQNAKKGKGEEKIRVYAGDIRNINHSYNDLAHKIAVWKDVPSIHIQICRAVFVSADVSFPSTYNRVGEYEKEGCIYKREVTNNQQSLFNRPGNGAQTEREMSKFSKNTAQKEEKTEHKKLPDHLDFGCGMANLIETPNGYKIIEIKIPFEDISNRLEDEKVFLDISQYSGWETSKGELWLKLKAIPLKAAKEGQTHFIKLDYFVPKEEKS